MNKKIIAFSLVLFLLLVLSATIIKGSAFNITMYPDLALFVAVGVNGEARYSSNGINWTTTGNAGSTTLWGVTYSTDLGLYVAVGNDGAVQYSSNGINWTNTSAGSTGLRGVTYSTDLGLFVAVGSGCIVQWSTNGINWTNTSAGSCVQLINVAYSGDLGLFAAVGEGGVTRWSLDGKVWTTTGSIGSVDIHGVKYSSDLGLFAAVGQSASSRYWSTDGKAWTTGTGGVNAMYDLEYSSDLGLFVAVGQNGVKQWSTDGKAWTTGTGGGATTLYGVAYHSDLGLFVAVGNNGAVDWSTDGKAWTTTGNAGSSLLLGSGAGLKVENNITINFNILDGVTNINGTNYTGGFNYNMETFCNLNNSFDIQHFMGGTEIYKKTYTCIEGLNYNFTDAFSYGFDEYTADIKILFNYTSTGYTTPLHNQTYIWDATPPIIILNHEYSLNHTQGIINFSMQCHDNYASVLHYNYTLNDGELNYSYNNNNNTVHWQYINITRPTNTIKATCADYVNTTTTTYTIKVINSNINLIDEKEGTLFDVNNLTSVRLYYDNNQTFYDFKTENTSTYYFIGTYDESLRLELVYPTGETVTRYIDTDLIDDNTNLRLCVNKADVVHYEQIFQSTSNTGLKVYSIFADCYILAGYTRFGFREGKIIKAFSIPTQYNVYYKRGNTWVFLSNLDGSIAGYTNIDSLIFNQKGYDVLSGGTGLTFEKINDDIVKLFFYNNNNDAHKTNINITRQDTGALVASITETTSPNDFTYNFNHSMLLNTTKQLVFKASATTYDENNKILKTVNSYFNMEAQKGILNPRVGFAVGLLIAFFGLTLASTRHTFSWFGIFILIGSIAVLAFSAPAWYNTVLITFNIIGLMYIGVIMWRNDTLQVT